MSEKYTTCRNHQLDIPVCSSLSHWGSRSLPTTRFAFWVGTRGVREGILRGFGSYSVDMTRNARMLVGPRQIGILLVGLFMILVGIVGLSGGF